MIGSRAHPFILLAFCILLFFLGLGSVGLTDRDEGSNAEAAREMLQSGDWLTPTLNGVPRFAKPALIYWLISASYALFGVSEVTARLPSALFGTALILMQYYFARRWLGPATGFRAALMLLLNFEIVALGHMVLTDMALTFFTTLGIYCFFEGMWGEGRAKLWYWGFYAAMALATLTKGPVGVLVPLLALVPYLILTRKWLTVLRECRPVAGTFLFLGIAAPWYAGMFLLHGSAYAGSAKGDTFTRYFSVIGGHGGTLLFYVPVLLIGLFPWSGFLPAALVQALRGSRTTHELENPARSLAILCAVWVISVFVFFTLAATRLPHYIAPLFPAATLLVANTWDRWLAEPRARAANISMWLTLGIGASLGLALIGMDWAYERFLPLIAQEFPAAQETTPGWGPMLLGFFLLAGMGLFGFAVMEGRAGLSFAIASVLMSALMITVIMVILPKFHRYFIAPPQELAAIAGLNLGPQDILVAYGAPAPSLLFYARRECTAAIPCIEGIKPGEEDKLQPLLHRPGQLMVLTQERLRSRLPAPASAYPVVLSRHGYVLLAKKPVF